MTGRINYVRGRGRTHSEIEYLHGLTLLSVTFCEPEGLRPKKLERRWERVERIFRNAEVSRVILPEGFPHGGLLRQVRPVEPLTFYRGIADLLVLRLLEQRGIATKAARVALAGPRLCPELCGAARRLCSLVREVRIDVPGEDGGRFARLLQQEFGVPVLPQTAPVDVTASFGLTAATADLCLWAGAPRQVVPSVKADGIILPAEIEQPVLALLWEQGRLRRDVLQVVNIP